MRKVEKIGQTRRDDRIGKYLRQNPRALPHHLIAEVESVFSQRSGQPGGSARDHMRHNCLPKGVTLISPQTETD